ncbi:hypothetical protein GWI72_07185 [Microvirga tunisiensis]|uniref:Sel1 repeat family protein n=1 Tax=Pannonibacter tanglangensis TaxID=2750084 RepID=A0A7X5J7Z9_9HYPH|nr:tetratricopeptide repeat protein [Pannonibacter sp. XCT-53]NBN78047.1 hypothetical protein [Pannonibacter sp. XCT-53]
MSLQRLAISFAISAPLLMGTALPTLAQTTQTAEPPQGSQTSPAPQKPASVSELRKVLQDGGSQEAITSALQQLQARADQGDRNALHVLGDYLSRNASSGEDREKAIDLLTKAGQAGNSWSYVRLGDVFSQGAGVERDAARAFGYYSAAADGGNKVAQLAVARALIAGDGVATDVERGLALLTGLAEEGDRNALLALGDLYSRGTTVPLDGARAVDYLTRAAEAGNTAAHTRLGEIYRDGIGVPVDPARSLAAFQAAQASGAATADLRLAEAALWGVGETQDVEKGVRLLREQASAGNIGAMLLLSEVLLRGELVAANVADGMKLLEDAAAKGNVTATLRLAEAYRTGAYVKRDTAKALQLSESAAAAGNPAALLDLARGHMDGEFGRLSNRAKAAAYLKQAEEMNVPAATVLAADWMLRGQGMRMDVAGALAKLEKAATAGNADAARRLITLYRSGSGKMLKPNPVKARAALSAYAPLLGATFVTREELFISAVAAASRAEFAALAEAFKAAPQQTRVSLLTTLRWSNANAFVYLVQDELQTRGLYKGPLNGLLTRDTIRAIGTLCDAGPSGERCRQGPLTGDAARLIAVRVAAGA